MGRIGETLRKRGRNNKSVVRTHGQNSRIYRWRKCKTARVRQPLRGRGESSYLPGLTCLNFPNAIQPIAEKLPVSLRQKWEKEITKHSEKNGGEYPGFHIFSKVVQDQARIKSNPNILAVNKRTPATPAPPNRREKEKSNQVLKTDAQPPIQPNPLTKK